MKKKHVLVIDDDTDLNESLTEFLCDAGYAVDSVTDPDQVDSVVADGNYDAVLLDLKMPNRSGTDFIETIKQALPRTILIVMSGKAFVQEMLEELNLDQYVDAILEKPFGVEILLEYLEDTPAS